MQDSWQQLKSDTTSWQRTLKNSHNSQIQWLVVSTLYHEMKNHLNQKVGFGWIPKLGPYWNQNWNYKQRQFSLVGQNFSWLEQVGHGLEQQKGERQQRAGNLWDAVRRFCVENECTCFCEPIKGWSKTTKTYSCQLLHKNFTHQWKNVDWCWARNLFEYCLPSVKTTEYSSSSWWSTSRRRWSDWILEIKGLSSVRNWEFSTLV